MQYANKMLNQLSINLYAKSENCSIESHEQSLPMIELQTILHMFQGIYAMDPCFITSHHGSSPLTHIHSFEHFCQIVIFPYIIIKSEVIDGVPKVMVDFKDTPDSMFEE